MFYFSDLTIGSFIRRKANWIFIILYTILCVILSIGVYGILLKYLIINDYNQIINSGDTIFVPIHSQSLVTSLTISVNLACQGTLYLVPENEVTLRKQNRARSETLNAQYLYLGLGSVIHFMKAASTNDTPQVWVTDSLETATSIANNVSIYTCAAPPQGTVCHIFMVGADSWDCEINETSYYWIQVIEKSKYDIGWNFTLYFYNPTDYTSYTRLDSTHMFAVITFNQPFAESPSQAVLFSADANWCQYENIKLTDVKIRDDVIYGGPTLLLISLFLCFFLPHMCFWHKNYMTKWCCTCR